MNSLSKYEPKPDSPCLCGSGIAFAKCCMGKYDNEAQSEGWKEYCEGDYNRALLNYRRHLTWYILCHKAHTVPFLSSGRVEALRLLEVDIKAMGELLQILHSCYSRVGLSESFPIVLDQLENAIEDPRWDSVIHYERSLWHMIEKKDRESAFCEISQINLADCEDPEILSLYLDVAPANMSFTNKLHIIDKIVECSAKKSCKLQYGAIKGMEFCMIGETEKGCDIIEASIAQYKSDLCQPNPGYGQYKLAQTLEILGEIRGDTSAVREAATLFQRELDSKTYTTPGQAMLCKSIGDCYLFMKEYGEAREYYKCSLEKDEKELTEIFLTRALIEAGEYVEARAILVGLDETGLDGSESYELALSWSLLASRTGEERDIECGKRRLKNAIVEYPMFEKQRDEVLIGLLEMSSRKGGSKLRKAIAKANRYLILKPNIFGLGLDMNRAIEDSVQRNDKKDRH